MFKGYLIKLFHIDDKYTSICRPVQIYKSQNDMSPANTGYYATLCI